MEDIYELIINENIYNEVVAGRCHYIALLNDKARRSYKVGNKLTLACYFGEEKQVIHVSISNLLYFATAKELIDMLGKGNCGYTARTTTDKIEDALSQEYSNERIEKFGLLAVEFVIE